MIIQCPSCSSKFLVPNNAIKAEGRKVKCSKCKHIWLQLPKFNISNVIPSIQKEITADPIPENSNLPVIKKKKVSPALKTATVVLLILNIIGTSFVYFKRKSYHTAYNERLPVSLYNINIKSEESEESKNISINGLMVNETENQHNVPEIRLTLYDDKNNSIKTVFLHSDNSFIMPEQTLSFTNTLENIDKKCHHILIETGYTKKPKQI